MKCSICNREISDQLQSGKIDYNAERKKIMKDNYVLENDMDICIECAKKEIIRWKREKIFDPALDQFSNFVNSSLYDYDETTIEALLQSFTRQHRSLQSNMFNIICKTIVRLSEIDENMYFDPRNSWVQNYCKVAKKAWKF